MTPEAGRRPFVSVIIPVYNGYRELARCLEGLSRQTYPPQRFEVLVVDNGSTDTDRTMQARFADVRWLQELSPGSYAARNKGIAEARGEILALTDADAVPAAGWLDEGVRALTADPPPDAVAGHIEMLVGPAPLTAAELYEQVFAFDQEQNVRRFHYAVTANLLAWRSAFERTGPFDARLRSGGDREWGDRAHALGLTLAYAPDAVVQHPPRRSVADLRKKVRRIAAGSYVRLSEEWRTMPIALRSAKKTAHWARLAVKALVYPPFSLAHARIVRRKRWPWRRTFTILGVSWWVRGVRVKEMLRVAHGGEPPR